MSAEIFAIVIFVVVASLVALAAFFISKAVGKRGPLQINRDITRADVKQKSHLEAKKVGTKGSAGNSQRSMSKSRTNIFAASVIAVLGVLAGKVWSLQVLEGSSYAEKAQANMSANTSITARRGRILDRNGKELIVNRASKTVVASSSLIDSPKTIHKLSLVLGMPKQAIVARLMDETSGAQSDRIIASDVSMQSVAYIAENPTVFPGISVETRSIRYYPYATLAAHLLGYTGTISEDELKNQPDGMEYESGDVVGKTGAEAAFEPVLQGTKGVRTYRVNSSGEPLGVVGEIEPTDGNDVRLTIDYNTQVVAEQALQDAFLSAQSRGYRNARRGAIVAMEVKTGGILAMASAPVFNPNDFTGGISSELWDSLNSETSGYPMTNRAIAGQYPAASTYKSFTGLAGLSHNLVTPQTSFDCEGTWTGFGDRYPKKCWLLTGHGYLNIYRALAESCDVYFYDVARAFYGMSEQPEAMQDYLKSWGFGSKTGIEIAGEQPGRVPTPSWKSEYYWETPESAQWVPGDLANIIIGQGDVLVTPMQICTGYAGIATGKLLKPHVLYQVLGASNQVVIDEKVTQSDFNPQFSAENIQVIRDGLRRGVTSGGVSSVFAGFKYNMAAKSGTGETGSSERDDYAWFCAYGPIEDPQYVCACVVEQGGEGTPTAGPAVRKVLAQLLGVAEEGTVSVDATGER